MASLKCSFPWNIIECHGKGFSLQNMRRQPRLRYVSTPHNVTFVGATLFALVPRAYSFHKGLLFQSRLGSYPVFRIWASNCSMRTYRLDLALLFETSLKYSLPWNIIKSYGKWFSFQNMHKQQRLRCVSTLTYVGASPFALVARACSFHKGLLFQSQLGSYPVFRIWSSNCSMRIYRLDHFIST